MPCAGTQDPSPRGRLPEPPAAPAQPWRYCASAGQGLQVRDGTHSAHQRGHVTPRRGTSGAGDRQRRPHAQTLAPEPGALRCRRAKCPPDPGRAEPVQPPLPADPARLRARLRSGPASREGPRLARALWEDQGTSAGRAPSLRGQPAADTARDSPQAADGSRALRTRCGALPHPRAAGPAPLPAPGPPQPGGFPSASARPPLGEHRTARPAPGRAPRPLPCGASRAAATANLRSPTPRLRSGLRESPAPSHPSRCPPAPRPRPSAGTTPEPPVLGSALSPENEEADGGRGARRGREPYSGRGGRRPPRLGSSTDARCGRPT